jgi:hypothetical protein
MKKTQVCFWIAEVRRGREDLSDHERPGRQPDISLDELSAHRIEADPQTTVRKIADFLGISPQTVIDHLRDDLKKIFPFATDSSHYDGSSKIRGGMVRTRDDSSP